MLFSVNNVVRCEENGGFFVFEIIFQFSDNRIHKKNFQEPTSSSDIASQTIRVML